MIGARFSDVEIDELNAAIEAAAKNPKYPEFKSISDYIRWCVLPNMRQGKGK